jgi:tetratricopeptide (TPR) repeat protein
MKNYRILAIIVAVIAVSFSFVGFQCSSAELTSAKLYISRSEWDKAEEQLQKDLVTNPQDEEAWYYLGYVRGEKQNWAGMQDAFQHALSISDVDKKNIISTQEHYWVQLYNLGTKNLQTGKDTSSNYDKAIVAFKSAIIVEPDSLLSYKGLAYTYLNMALDDSAVQPLSVLWERVKDEDAAKFLGEIYYEKGQKLKQSFLDGNAGKLDTLKNVNSIEEGMSQEEVAATIGQPDQKTSGTPVKTKGKKKSTVPSSQETWVYKTYGLTLTFDQDRLKTKKVDFVYSPQIDSTQFHLALAQFQKALEIVLPASKLYQEDRDLMTLVTNSYIAADMTEQATETFRAGAVKNPDNADYQYNYGVILLRSDDFENAVAQFKKAVDAGNATVEQLQAKLSNPDSSVDVDKAKQDLSRTQSTIWNATYNLGASYVNWGVHIQSSAPENSDPDSLRVAVTAKYKQAMPFLEKYSVYKADDPNIWELLGKVYSALNDKQKATDAFKKADSLRQVH